MSANVLRRSIRISSGRRATSVEAWLAVCGIEAPEIRRFTAADVDSWAQTELQRRHLLQALTESGDYLAAVQADGRIVGKIGIRYDQHPGAGNLHQFDVVEGLRGHGIGSQLLQEAEQRIRDHGCTRVTLGVEETNLDAIRLYERRGYEAFDSEDAEWDQEEPDGTIFRYHCRCLLMQRDLHE